MTLAIFVYAAVAVFVAGNACRVRRIVAMPAHLRWELYPIPRGPAERQRYGGSYFEESEWWTKPLARGVLSEAAFIAQEVVFQKSVWKHNRALWPWSWLLHAGLYGLVGALLLAVAAVGATRFGMRGTLVEPWAAMLPWFCMPAGLLGATGLGILRLSSHELRPYSSRATFLNLAVLAAIFGTGLASLLHPHGGSLMVELLGAVLRAKAAPALPAVAVAHVIALGCFIAYFPFTQMTHAYMKFFAFHRVRWDDTPTRADARMQARISANLQRPITWSAPHIRGAGATWAEVTATGAGNDATRS